MSDLEKLKSLDPKEVFKKTYISPKVVKQLIDEEFGKIGNRAKAHGFVTILERELNLDLTELRERIDEYFGKGNDGAVFEIKEKENEGEEKRFSFVLIIFVLLAFGIGGYYLIHQERKYPHNEVSVVEDNRSDENSTEPKIVEGNATLMIAQMNENEKNETNSSKQIDDKNESEKLLETNETNETNETSEIIHESNQSLEVKDKPILPSVTIIPKKKIWIGIIYLDNYKRVNILSSKPIELNTSRDQLIVTGHGLFTIDEDGIKKEIHEKGKVRMLYKNGELEIIDTKTFKKYNRGKNW